MRSPYAHFVFAKAFPHLEMRTYQLNSTTGRTHWLASGCLQNMVTSVASRRGSPKLCFEGYIYTKHMSGDDKTEIREISRGLPETCSYSR